jgi:uncharacterized protein
MLIEFQVGNFRSLCEPARFSMVASKLKAKHKQLDRDNVVPLRDELALLRTAAIYGPNASGKSNLVRALRFMRDFVLQSSLESQAGDPIAVEPFLLRDDTVGAPSRFEVVFELDAVQYRYGFELDAQRVHAEWLFARKSSRERTLFERNLQEFKLGADFRKEAHGLDERTRPNALFLSVVAQWNGALATTIVGWFRRIYIVSGMPDRMMSQISIHQLESSESGRTALVRLIRALDLGIEDLRIERSDDPGPAPTSRAERIAREVRRALTPVLSPHRVRTKHRRYASDGSVSGEVELDLAEHESDGTQKLFALAGLILGVLERGDRLVVDELDMRLHPLLTCELVRLFHTHETNPHAAQLVFTTHDINLLGADLLRRDQVWFAEKDRLGATQLYSLAEFKIRSDASFEKDYLRGKYGAIPFVRGLQELVEEAVDE